MQQLASEIRNIKQKTSGNEKNKRYCEWDYTHNDIEVYNKGGKYGVLLRTNEIFY